MFIRYLMYGSSDALTPYKAAPPLTPRLVLPTLSQDHIPINCIG